jgi:molybdopterin molybdotransferase
VPDKLPSISEARRLVLGAVTGPLGTERIAVEQAVDRVLAESVYAQGDVPPFPSSAMDGYALKPGARGRRLRVVGESRAGSPFASGPGAEEAVRISTGGAVPLGASAVIRQEDVNLTDGTIETLADVDAGENVRFAGGDLRAGALVLGSGSLISPNALGVAIGAGVATVTVAQRPRVGVVCTGDELRSPGEQLGPGEIHNSNGAMLAALAARCGAVTDPVVTVRDDRDGIEEALDHALRRCDVLILTGGVSVGPHDHVRPALEQIGVRQHMWGVALQPGKPTFFGTRGVQLVFGLPGNPVSAVVTFTLFARPALAALQGQALGGADQGSAVLAEAVRRRADRERAVCVTLSLGAQATVATPTGIQESHLLSSLRGADALAIVPAGEGDLPAGSVVALEPMIR